LSFISCSAAKLLERPFATVNGHEVDLAVNGDDALSRRGQLCHLDNQAHCFRPRWSFRDDARLRPAIVFVEPHEPSAFTQALADSGWTNGRNVRIDLRWPGADPIPCIVFYALICAARSLKVVPITAPVHGDVEIETAIIALGREPGGGLVIIPDVFMKVHRAPIILAAARNNVPAVYWQSAFPRDGGLLSYRVDSVDTHRRAATYVDRILRGEKPGDLPVQLPTKFEVVVNRKTAKALGLAVPHRSCCAPPR
jgi:hypothetical protein